MLTAATCRASEMADGPMIGIGDPAILAINTWAGADDVLAGVVPVALTEEVPPNPTAVSAAPAAYPSTYAAPSYAALSTPGPIMDAPADVTMDEVRTEIKKLAWTKGEMKIVPYGMLWGSMIYHTHRTYTDAYTLWVLPEPLSDEDAFTIDTRRTRLGIDVSGPKIPAFNCAPISGKVEIDFQGAFTTENKPGVLLRHAYGEVKDDYFRLLAGQTWDVISPLNPGVLEYAVLWDQGNIGYRRAQIRLERYYHVDCDHILTAELSANQNILPDFATSSAAVHQDATGWPMMEGRVAWTDKDPAWTEGPSTIGCSGHIGAQQYDFLLASPPPFNLPARNNVEVITWSGNIDVHVPITKHTGVQGEAFYGNDLSTFLGGIGQGVSLYTQDGIRSRGGWVDVWHDWNSCWHSHAGFAVDNPLDRDVVTGRCYNQIYFANVTHDITDFVVIGLELSFDKTKYIATDAGGNATFETADSVGLEFTGMYKF